MKPYSIKNVKTFPGEMKFRKHKRPDIFNAVLHLRPSNIVCVSPLTQDELVKVRAMLYNTKFPFKLETRTTWVDLTNDVALYIRRKK